MDAECGCTDGGFMTSYEGPRAIGGHRPVTGRAVGWVDDLLRAQPGTDWDDSGHCFASADAAVAVELRRLPDCPLADGVRAALNRVAAEMGVAVGLVEVEGSFASPSLLVGGADVTGRDAAGGAACRLDLPTEEQVRAALLAHSRRRT